MRAMVAMTLMGISLSACRRMEDRPARDARDSQIVALSVLSEPPGAKVKVNQIARTWITPCDIADFSIHRGPVDVELTLEGYAPQRQRLLYDGSEPVTLSIKLDRMEPPPAKPAPAPAPVEEPAARPAPVKVESTGGGMRIKVTAKDARVRVQAKMVVTDPEKPGEFFLPSGASEKAIIEFLDPKTDAVLQTVELSPGAPSEAPGIPPAVKDPPVLGADRVGEVKVVSKTYGVFVKLDPGLSLQPGEEILIYRGGKEVARTKILKITKGDPAYPDGAAQVQKDGTIQKGDEVRRPKP
jgi:hypothetical protein